MVHVNAAIVTVMVVIDWFCFSNKQAVCWKVLVIVNHAMMCSSLIKGGMRTQFGLLKMAPNVM